MKLSELLAKPLKLKGGGFLNLKGFSKRIIDKEVGGNDDNSNNGDNNNSENNILSNYIINSLIDNSFITSNTMNYDRPTYSYTIGAPTELPDNVNDDFITIDFYNESDELLFKALFSKIPSATINNISYNKYGLYAFKDSEGINHFYNSSSTHRLTTPNTVFTFYSEQSQSDAPAM